MSFFGRRNKVERIPRDIDIIHSHSDAQHICWMKLFPLCVHNEEITLNDHRRFHLRFYFPRRESVEIKPRFERVIIMINGLDEVEYYTLYDQLGAAFAARNIASVLIPLPDHLHRHHKFRREEIQLTSEQKKWRPSMDMDIEPLIMYERYSQLMNEIQILTKHIRGINCKDKETICSFYSRYFSPDARISLLGYSLGGLAALSAFLKNPNNYNVCVLLSSGVKLLDIEISKVMASDKWKDIILKLQKKWTENKKKGTGEDAQYFEDIFLGYRPETLSEILKEHVRRILFVLGGADPMIHLGDLMKIEPPESGFALLRLPGISHFLAISEAWVGWSEVIIDFITSFEENATHEFLSENEIVRTLAKWQRTYRMFKKDKSTPDFNKLPVDRQQQFISYYEKLIGYVGTPFQAISDVQKESRKMVLNELIEFEKEYQVVGKHRKINDFEQFLKLLEMSVENEEVQQRFLDLFKELNEYTSGVQESAQLIRDATYK
jgi:hypothetical protein